MKRLIALALMVVMLLIPWNVQGNERSQQHYYVICQNGESYRMIPVDGAIAENMGNNVHLPLLLELGVEEIWSWMDHQPPELVPVAFLLHGINTTVDALGLTVRAEMPLFLNDTHLEIVNTIGVMAQPLYFLGSSMQIPTEPLLKYISVDGKKLFHDNMPQGLFNINLNGSLALWEGTGKIVPPPMGELDVTTLMNGLDHQIYSYRLGGEVQLNQRLTLLPNQTLEIKQGGNLSMPQETELYVGSRSTIENMGSITGLIRNQGKINNQAGATIGGSLFYNLAGGTVYNAGLLGSLSVRTEKGSVITNVSGGRLAAVPVGDGDYPGKIKQPAPPQPVPDPSPNNRDDDDDSSSSQTREYISLPQIASSISQTQASLAVRTAITQAQVQQAGQAVVRLYDTQELTAQALNTFWQEEKDFPLTLYVFSPGKSEKSVDVRLAVKPSALSVPCNLAASTFHERATATQQLFSRHFEGNFRVVSLAYQGDFVQPVEVAARLELSEFSTDTMFFYAYDTVANTYRSIQNPQHWLDSSGFLHFYTFFGGDLIISDVALP